MPNPLKGYEHVNKVVFAQTSVGSKFLLHGNENITINKRLQCIDYYPAKFITIQ